MDPISIQQQYMRDILDDRNWCKKRRCVRSMGQFRTGCSTIVLWEVPFPGISLSFVNGEDSRKITRVDTEKLEGWEVPEILPRSRQT
jgi:hypothetical protein